MVVFDERTGSATFFNAFFRDEAHARRVAIDLSSAIAARYGMPVATPEAHGKGKAMKHDLSRVPTEHRSAVATRIAAITDYESRLPERRAGRVKLADTIAASIGISRAQFYSLVRQWRATRDPATLSDRTGIKRGSIRSGVRMSADIVSILAEEIQKARPDDTDVTIRGRVAARLTGRDPPSLPTIARHRRNAVPRSDGDRLDEVVDQVLKLMDATRCGIADLAPRHAVRAARHLARHLKADLVVMGLEEVDLKGADPVLARIDGQRGPRPLLLVVTGATGARDPRIAQVRRVMRAGDSFVAARVP